MRSQVLTVSHFRRPGGRSNCPLIFPTRHYSDLYRLQDVHPMDQLTYAAGAPEDRSARCLHQANRDLCEARRW